MARPGVQEHGIDDQERREALGIRISDVLQIVEMLMEKSCSPKTKTYFFILLRIFPAISTAHQVFRYALPNVNRPNREMMLSTTGIGFIDRSARGMEDPPRTTEARRHSSSPYGWRV
jgi:hypothetical protein